jgi:PAS domain S-box-containing protein
MFAAARYVPCRRKDGTPFLGDISTFPLEVDETRYNVGFFTDTTDRREAEEELTKSNLLFREAQEIAALGHWNWDLRKNEGTWSAQMYHIFGVPADTFTPVPELFDQTIHPDDRGAFVKMRDDMVEHGSVMAVDHRIVRPDGVVRHVCSRARVVGECNRKPLRIFGVVQDITDRIAAEQPIHAEKERLAVTLSSIGDGVIATDVDSRISLFDDIAASITDWKKEEACG